MKVLVTGAGGQLGTDVCAELCRRNSDVIAADVAEFDLTDPARTERFITGQKPDAVVHCAAYTAVDRAEEEPALCFQINAEGSAAVARAAEQVGAKLVYVSTDYVFAGQGETPFETDDPKAPLNVYGESKLAGEEACREICTKLFVVRTSWVFGLHGGNFVKTMLRLGKERNTVSVVADQVGSPTYTPDLAKVLCDLIETERYGVYHAANEGFCSWYDFTKEIFAQAGLAAEVCPVTSDAYPVKATRPKNSRLSKQSLADNGFSRLPAWQNALERFLKAI